jgi:hypothetical protein
MTRPRPTPSGRPNSQLVEANPERETESRLTRGQPRAGDTVVTGPRPASGEKRIFDSPKGVSNDAPGATRLDQSLRPYKP